MSIKQALSGFGWLLAIVAFFGGMAVGDTAHPIDQVAPAFAPAAHDFCKSGWEAQIVRVETQDFTSYTCTREGWTVVLDGQGRFSVAEKGGKFTSNPNEVPGW